MCCVLSDVRWSYSICQCIARHQWSRVRLSVVSFTIFSLHSHAVSKIRRNDENLSLVTASYSLLSLHGCCCVSSFNFSCNVYYRDAGFHRVLPHETQPSIVAVTSLTGRGCLFETSFVNEPMISQPIVSRLRVVPDGRRFSLLPPLETRFSLSIVNSHNVNSLR